MGECKHGKCNTYVSEGFTYCGSHGPFTDLEEQVNSLRAENKRLEAIAQAGVKACKAWERSEFNSAKKLTETAMHLASTTPLDSAEADNVEADSDAVRLAKLWRKGNDYSEDEVHGNSSRLVKIEPADKMDKLADTILARSGEGK